MDDQNKNLILATVLSFLVILVWFFLFPPEAPDTPAEGTVSELPSDTPSGDNGLDAQTSTSPAAETTATLDNAPRIPVSTPELKGSISLLGGRIDDISLTRYNASLGADEDVALLRPFGEVDAYYAAFGWAAVAGVDPEAVPTPDTLWSIEDGETLTPETPVTLAWDNGSGQIFRREIAVDEHFMFTVTQSVENNGTGIELRPYGLIRRHTEPDALTNIFVVHEGLVRTSDGTLETTKYRKIRDYRVSETSNIQEERIDVEEAGWIGYTDHYWLTSLIPAQGTPFRSVSKYFESRDLYQAEAVMPVATVANGARVEVKTQLFVGAKEWERIREYQNTPSSLARLFGAQQDPARAPIKGFIDAIDWGWFFFLTKPIFAVLHWLNGIIGNMGWAIMALTLILKAIVLPLAYRSYVSMARMKELQPEMEKLKEQAGDDRQKLQKGMMQLYKDNKVNPASGCMPILLQIPIFFSLYKVIFNTIEVRHAPWVGWLTDLSAPDPSSIFNLFGLLPYSVPNLGILEIFSLGVLPIFLGVSMWLQQKLNPAPTDPTQKMIFAWMPWVFMFMLGSFASGLVLYWITNNVITFVQQYAIMRSHGHKPDVFGNILTAFKKAPAEEAANSNKKPGKK